MLLKWIFAEQSGKVSYPCLPVMEPSGPMAQPTFTLSQGLSALAAH